MDVSIDEQFSKSTSQVKRIKKFSVFQTAKVIGIIYFILMAVIFIPIGLISSLAGSSAIPGFPMGGGGVFFLFAPILYGILGFIMGALGCWIYNLVSGWTGGFEVEIETSDNVI